MWSKLELQDRIYRFFSKRKTYHSLPLWKRLFLIILPSIYAEVGGVRLTYKVTLTSTPYLVEVEKMDIEEEE